jgi:MFS family permease
MLDNRGFVYCELRHNMKHDSTGLTFIFSCVGHAYIHMFTAFYFVIVLSLEKDWQMPFHELLELWTLGALLVGVAALPAGWLGDRWSPSGMMVVFYVGMGASSVAAGFAPSPGAMLLALAGIGLFASIYHPVGIPWLVRSAARRRGKLLGVNGIFGGIGAALGGLVAGGLIEFASWRAAFMVPGAVSIATGIALWWSIERGWVSDDVNVQSATDVSNSRADALRVFGILLLTMFAAGLIYHATQAALPKVFDLRNQDLIGGGVLGVGVLVAIVYVLGSLMQVLGGHLADRLPLKTVYLWSYVFQVPVLWLLGLAFGLPLVVVAILSVMLGAGVLPAENMLLARYTPQHHHGVAFGMKFVLAFGAAPLAVELVSFMQAGSGEFSRLFVLLALTAAGVCILALGLPGERLAVARS